MTQIGSTTKTRKVPHLLPHEAREKHASWQGSSLSARRNPPPLPAEPHVKRDGKRVPILEHAFLDRGFIYTWRSVGMAAAFRRHQRQIIQVLTRHA